MTIQKIKADLETKTHPVAKALFKGKKSKVLAMAFQKGMILKEHKTQDQAKLVVIEGSVQYIEMGKEVLLQQFDELDIPFDTFHSVKALEVSICLLIMESE